MRDFATQKLATGNSDRESKGCLRNQFSTHKLPEVSEARKELLREVVPMHSYRAFWLLFWSLLAGITATLVTPGRVIAQQTQPPPQQQRLVESVDIIGNRRLRKDDILYYIQTRPGDPYNVDQVQRDYRERRRSTEV